jgi:hypothetical protein
MSEIKAPHFEDTDEGRAALCAYLSESIGVQIQMFYDADGELQGFGPAPVENERKR